MGSGGSTVGERKHGFRYPWGEWFRGGKGKAFRLVRGADYACRTYSMMMMARTRAAALGYKVTAIAAKDEGSVLITVLGRRPKKGGGSR